MTPTRLHHAAIIASDIEASKRFYVEALGLRVVAETWREARGSWKVDLALPDGGQIELFTFPGAPPRPSYPEAQGLRHLAFVVDDLDAAVARLPAHGVVVEALRVDGLTQERFTFFADPDGLPLELVEPAPRTAASEGANDDRDGPDDRLVATGTFVVKLAPREAGASAAPLGRMLLDKTFHGDLEGTSAGEMLSHGNPGAGSAGYVAMEVFDGALAERRGTFALQHSATMHAGARQLSITVVPGSGTGALAGLDGALDIVIEGGAHAYVFRYTLPAQGLSIDSTSSAGSP
jgi:glyoxylase I family protein